MSMCLSIRDADPGMTLGPLGCSILVSTLLLTNVSSSKVVAAGGSQSAQHMGLETQQLDINEEPGAHMRKAQGLNDP